MATRVTSGASGIGSSTSRAEPAAWSYAVPIENAEEHEETALYTDQWSARKDQTERQPLSSNNINTLSRPKSRRKNKSFQGLDEVYMNQETLPPQSTKSEFGTLHGDRQHELYRPSQERLGAAARDRSGVRRKGSLGAISALGDKIQEDPNNPWIHRDKLAQIESRELAQMGINVTARPSRAGSHAGKKSSRAPSVDLKTEYDEESDQLDRDLHDEKRQRIGAVGLNGSPIAEADEQENAGPDDSFARSVGQRNNISNRQNRKPSVSRIPVTKSSPGKENEDETDASTLGYRGNRLRSSSAGSAQLLQGTVPTSNGSGLQSANHALQKMQDSPTSSPSKLKSAKLPPNVRKNARGGKPPTPSTDSSRPRTASSSDGNNSRRPGTSSGKPRVEAPEGDPPWLANSYRPDPRLPPDQQMLPTVARRLAQEREEAERRAREPSEDSATEQQGANFSEIEQWADAKQVHGEAEKSDFSLVDQDESAQSGSDSLATNGLRLDKHNPRTSSLPKSSPSVSTFAQAGQGDGQAQLHTQSSFQSTGEKRASPRLDSAAEIRESAQWPLKAPSPKDAEFPAPNSEPQRSFSIGSGRGTPAQERGAYNLMPTIHTQQELEQRAASRAGFSARNPTPTPTAPLNVTRMPEEKEQPGSKEKEAAKEEENEKPKEKEGGCAGCCVVM